MRDVSAIVIAVVTLVTSATAASAVPNELKGKSVVLTWTENRMQRREGASEFRAATISMGLSLYVSTEGRVFNRMQSNSGSSEQAPGEPLKGGRLPSFSGNTMTIMQPLRALARRIVVTFDGGFGSCTVSVIAGKEEGAGQGHLKAFGTGQPIEIQSVTATNTNCTVKNRNVFE